MPYSGVHRARPNWPDGIRETSRWAGVRKGPRYGVVFDFTTNRGVYSGSFGPAGIDEPTLESRDSAPPSLTHDRQY